MKKALAKNPNMLRTMVGTGLVLILILSYAVYSNTMDSEYYGYKTSNQSDFVELQENEVNMANWYFTTRDAITWLNVSVEGVVNESSVLVIEASGVEWYYSPLLGENSNLQIIKGRVSLGLPIEGLGYLQSDNISNAEDSAIKLINDEKRTISWSFKIISNNEVISNEGIILDVEIVSHEFISIEEFKLNPVQESIYSLATLIGCFFLLLFIPMTIYFSAMYKSKNDERTRIETPE